AQAVAGPTSCTASIVVPNRPVSSTSSAPRKRGIHSRRSSRISGLPTRAKNIASSTGRITSCAAHRVKPTARVASSRIELDARGRACGRFASTGTGTGTAASVCGEADTGGWEGGEDMRPRVAGAATEGGSDAGNRRRSAFGNFGGRFGRCRGTGPRRGLRRRRRRVCRARRAHRRGSHAGGLGRCGFARGGFGHGRTVGRGLGGFVGGRRGGGRADRGERSEEHTSELQS